MSDQFRQMSLGDVLDFQLSKVKPERDLDFAYCYMCDQLVDRENFTNTNNDVCKACRSSLAYIKLTFMETGSRWCGKCLRRQSLTEFQHNKAGFSLYCRLHEKEEDQRYRTNHPSQKSYRQRWLENLRSLTKCTNCGRTTDTMFVHLKDKLFDIGVGAQSHTNEEVRHEITKCEPLCPTCMYELTQSSLYRNGYHKKTPSVNWQELFERVDRSIEKNYGKEYMNGNQD